MKNFIKTAAFAAIIVLSIANCKAQTQTVTVPSQLVNTWSIGDLEIFKITSDQKFILVDSQYEYQIMPSSALNDASGTIVVGAAGKEIGRFNYIINEGIMTVSNGTASFEAWSKMNLIATGGEAVPNQLVGTWRADGIEFFRITSDRKMYVGEHEFIVMSSSELGAASGVIVIGYVNAESGRVYYYINDGKMTISSGTESLDTWSGIVLTKQ